MNDKTEEKVPIFGFIIMSVAIIIVLLIGIGIPLFMKMSYEGAQRDYLTREITNRSTAKECTNCVVTMVSGNYYRAAILQYTGTGTGTVRGVWSVDYGTLIPIAPELKVYSTINGSYTGVFNINECVMNYIIFDVYENGEHFMRYYNVSGNETCM